MNKREERERERAIQKMRHENNRPRCLLCNNENNKEGREIHVKKQRQESKGKKNEMRKG